MNDTKQPEAKFSAKARVEGDIIENPAFAWTLWVASVVVNALGMWVWLIFGRIGSKVSEAEFFGVSAIGAAITVVMSIVAIVLKRPTLGILLVWSTLPIIIIVLIALSGGA